MKKKQKLIEGYIRNRDANWMLGFFVIMFIIILIGSTYQQSIQYGEGYINGWDAAEQYTEICEEEKEKIEAISSWISTVCSEELEICVKTKTLEEAGSIIEKLSNI